MENAFEMEIISAKRYSWSHWNTCFYIMLLLFHSYYCFLWTLSFESNVKKENVRKRTILFKCENGLNGKFWIVSTEISLHVFANPIFVFTSYCTLIRSDEDSFTLEKVEELLSFSHCKENKNIRKCSQLFARIIESVHFTTINCDAASVTRNEVFSMKYFEVSLVH